MSSDSANMAVHAVSNVNTVVSRHKHPASHSTTVRENASQLSELDCLPNPSASSTSSSVQGETSSHRFDVPVSQPVLLPSLGINGAIIC
jgi:hypothetical protein